MLFLQARHLKLVPMGAVACCISKNSYSSRHSEESVPALIEKDETISMKERGSYFPSISGIYDYMSNRKSVYPYR
jgi:hypothetical protein